MNNDYSHLQFTLTDGIATIAFNRPDQLNAMNRSMMEEIIRALEVVRENATIRIAILTGNGKAFMAGADIKEYANQTEEEFETFQSRGSLIYSLIEENAKPVIAAVNGYAFGGGMEIALACDVVFAAEEAQFGLPEIKLALIPGGGGTQRLARKTSVNFAKELLLSGRTATAQELWQRGFINHITKASELMEETRRFATDLAKRPAPQLDILKQLVERGAGPVDADAYKTERDALAGFYRTDAAREKIQAFYRRSQEKRS